MPFEQQLRAPGSRMCGAAALAMVYRGLDVECCQSELWAEISRPGGHGARVAKTHLLALDAIRRGLDAVVLQAARPWPMLGRLARTGAGVILNHRLQADSALGHYSVLVSIDRRSAVLHDPHLGPDRSTKRAELLSLWTPGGDGCEIIGNVLVAILRDAVHGDTCPRCGCRWPAAVSCPSCAQPVPLASHRVLGCVEPDCSRRAWSRIFCPYCDYELRDVPT